MLIRGKALVAGGCSTEPCGSYIRDSELYDPVLNKWTETGGMVTARGAQTATLLHNGEVLVMRGSDGSALALSKVIGGFRSIVGQAYQKSPTIPDINITFYWLWSVKVHQTVQSVKDYSNLCTGWKFLLTARQ